MSENGESQAANMAVVRRLLEEGFGQGNVKWLTYAVTDDYIGHFTHGDHYGPDGVRIDIAGFRTVLSDLTVEIDDLFASGDKVVRRFTFRGRTMPSIVDASSGSISVEISGIAIDRLHEGRLVESWVRIGPWIRDGYLSNES